MKKDFVTTYLVAGIIAIVAMCFFPFVSYKGESITMFKMIDYLGSFDTDSSEVAMLVVGCIAAFILVCIGSICAIVSLSNEKNYKFSLLMTSIPALGAFLLADVISSQSEIGVYVALIAMAAMVICALASGSSRAEVVVAQAEPTKEDFAKYNEANKLSDTEVDELLSRSRDELNVDYVKALEFVQKERVEQKKVNAEIEASYEKAIGLSREERYYRLRNSSLYTKSLISAIKYMKRCADSEIEPTKEGFLASSESGYVAPETPTEKVCD